MAALCFLLFAACLTDYRKGKISNVLILLIYLVGYGWCLWDTGPAGTVLNFAGSFLTFILTYPLFRIGALGAGDVKLLSAAAVYLPGKTCLIFLFISLLISALFSVFKLMREHSARERFLYFISYVSEVIRTGNFSLYIQNERERSRAGICLSGPIFLSALLHLGGVY